MKIIQSEREDDDGRLKLNTQNGRVKFVLCGECDVARSKIVSIFQNGKLHVVAAKELIEDTGLEFLGAGFINVSERDFKNGVTAEWGSDTCMEKYKRDRPADEKCANELLIALQKIMPEIFVSIITTSDPPSGSQSLHRVEHRDSTYNPQDNPRSSP
jgi:hypothetical protein